MFSLTVAAGPLIGSGKAADQREHEEAEEHPFCPCCLLTGSFEAFRELIEGNGFHGLRLFAARDVVGAWYPFGENHTVIRKNVACQNCFLSACTREHLRCLTDISVDEVWTACRRMLTYR